MKSGFPASRMSVPYSSLCLPKRWAKSVNVSTSSMAIQIPPGCIVGYREMVENGLCFECTLIREQDYTICPVIDVKGTHGPPLPDDPSSDTNPRIGARHDMGAIIDSPRQIDGDTGSDTREINVA